MMPLMHPPALPLSCSCCTPLCTCQRLSSQVSLAWVGKAVWGEPCYQGQAHIGSMQSVVEAVLDNLLCHMPHHSLLHMCVIHCCAVLELVLGRFPSDPSILLTFAQHALSTTSDAAATAASAAAADADAAAERSSCVLQLEQLVLEVLERHERPCEAVKANQMLSGQLHVLLYNRGVLKFEAKRFDTAVRFLTASLDFAEVRTGLYVCVWGVCVCPCQKKDKSRQAGWGWRSTRRSSNSVAMPGIREPGNSAGIPDPFALSVLGVQDARKAAVSRVLVTCHLLLSQHTQAANYCRLAGEARTTCCQEVAVESDTASSRRANNPHHNQACTPSHVYAPDHA